MTISNIKRVIASKPDHRILRHLHSRVFGRSFCEDTEKRLLVLFRPSRISYSSAYPFIAYEDSFRSKYDVQIRLMRVQQALESGIPPGLANATHVIVQSKLTYPQSLQKEIARLLETFPQGTVRAFLDTFANNDVRLASVFEGVDFYFKKSLFVDPKLFLSSTIGHTNLTDYYCQLYGLVEENTSWKVPSAFLSKLHLAPNFLTEPELMSSLLDGPEEQRQLVRDIDLHARLGGTETDSWYGMMRRHAAKAVDEITGVKTAIGTGVSRREFMDEMRRSKICFSPFGYGELCWRDMEAIAAGAVLVKPDMSHLKTEPHLYEEGVTYVACRWDFSDLEVTVKRLLEDPEKRHRISKEARRVARRYLEDDGPVSTYSALLSDDTVVNI